MKFRIPAKTSRSDAKKLELYRGRKAKRLHLFVSDVEPQSKKMREGDRIKFQDSLLKDMDRRGRQAFKGDIALDLRLATTRHNAPQAHTIAKNLLDLFGSADPSLGGPDRKVLYHDDSQIHALSVSCRHGVDEPTIAVDVRSMSAFRDLAIAGMSDRDDYMDGRDRSEDMRTLRDFIEQEASNKVALGDAKYDAMLQFYRWNAQSSALAYASVTTRSLAWLFDVPRRGILNPFPKQWDTMFRSAPLRIELGKLPMKPGESTKFKHRVQAEVAAFKVKWDWLISPLVVPVALQVVVRPSPGMPKGVLHDLDNIVRDYLIPHFVPTFGAVSDFRWLFESMREENPANADRLALDRMPPKGTRAGVTRYEAWRLPAAKKGEKGFVSAAIVLDDIVSGNLFEQIDREIGEWAEKLD
jgi:hypothetical protein